MSATPNRPMAMTTKPMPSESSGTRKVKRSVPEFTSVPIMPSRSPSTVTPIALSMAPLASTTAPTSPSAISAKYSGAWNCRPSSASGGEATAMNSVATEPAKNEPSAAIASAAPARPWRAIWWPSSVVTTDEVSPGRLTRMAVVEPPYCAP